MEHKVIAVLVTYEPDLSLLKDCLAAIEEQVDSIIIVDNNSTTLRNNTISIFKDVQSILLSENYGVAYAQNVGLEAAMLKNATHALLLDQDSVPSKTMVQDLLRKNKCFDLGEKIIASGPAYTDIRSGYQSYFFVEYRSIPMRWRRVKNAKICDDLTVGFLIASGTLIDLAFLRAVGGKRSDYFIDHVDTEWSFRARRLGFVLKGKPHAMMLHSLGDDVKKIWFFGKRQVAYHVPLRDYYMFRNTLLMLNDVEMTFFWKLHLISRLCQFAGYFLIFSGDRVKRFNFMFLGIKHGVMNIRGKLDVDSGKCIVLPRTALDP